MSLNGLDAPQVLDAYQTAVAESAGWFLLKYTSRDAVELLARGKSGVVEARDAIKAYTDPSPLYGLIIYRRRKILIKYLPDGTSRLLQARTTVHFQTVLERYSPYETVLEITSADALNDTSLAGSFQLHTASPSPSASRLDEIREDGEDSGPGAMRQVPSARSSSGNLSAQRYKTERRIDQLKRKTESAEIPTSPLRAGEISPALLQDSAPPPPPPKSKPSVSQYLVHEEQGQTSITRLESPLSTRSMTEDGVSVASTKSEDANVSDSASQTTLDAGESPKVSRTPSSPQSAQQRIPSAVSPLERELPELPSAQRLSLDKAVSGMGDSLPRLSLDDPYDLSKYDEWFKPKVKLGPRPVNPSENKTRSMGPRVSALPANFKPAAKKQEPARPSTYVPKGLPPVAPVTAPTPAAAPLLASFNYAPPPIPETPEYDPRPVSRGSVKSTTPSHKSTMMTPDKLRLMKAIEHRKKQMRKSRDQQSMKPPIPDDVPEVPEIPRQEAPLETADLKQAAPATGDNGQPQASKADSGIELHYEKGAQHEDQGSELPTSKPGTLQPEPGTSAAPSEDSTGESALPPNGDDLHEKEEESSAGETSTGAQVGTSPSSNDQTPTHDRETTERSGSDATVVPTIVMADGSRPLSPGGPVQSTEDDAASDSEEERIILMEDDQSTSDTTLEAPLSPRRQNSDLAKRRRGFVEPLKIEVSSGNPDDFGSDDDEFLDELHSATFQQAKPIMVSRSPVNGSFPDRRPSADTVTSVRSVNITRSAQTDKTAATLEGASLEPTKSQSSSTTITPPVEKNDSLAAMSRNVSSGISKRIQLLAEMTNREVHNAINLQSRPLTPEHSPNAFIQQDQRGRKANAPRARPKSFRRHSGHRSGQGTATATPTNENTPVWSVQHDPATNRNSVSVSARIVRPNVIDESNDEEDAFAYDPSLNERPDSAADDVPPSSATISQSNVSSPARSPTTSRFSADIRTLHSAASRFGRHRQNSSPVVEDFPPPPGAPVDEPAAPKEGGRTSRFFKRLTFGGSKRKSGAQSAPSNASITSVTSSATVTAADDNTGAQHSSQNSKASHRMSTADTPPAVVVGDLNVQFPDSLLWKRRIVTIDEAGNLQFAIAHAMEIHKGVAQKRYPLADFSAPYAPDLDSQELAHSVVLELNDGTALQAACEDAMTQRQVLHLLRTYWSAWRSI